LRLDSDRSDWQQNDRFFIEGDVEWQELTTPNPIHSQSKAIAVFSSQRDRFFYGLNQNCLTARTTGSQRNFMEKATKPSKATTAKKVKRA
jgi:hypothetical protein